MTHPKEINKQVLESWLNGYKGMLTVLAKNILYHYDIEDTGDNREYLRKRLSAIRHSPVFSPPFEGEVTGFTEPFLAAVASSPVAPVLTSIQASEIIERLNRESYRRELKVIYLVIGDIHAPFTSPFYFKHCQEIKEKYTIIGDALYGKHNWRLRIVFIGDIIDGQAISMHDHNPNLQSAGDEMTEAKASLHKWTTEFPVAYVTEGNHDSLYKRQVSKAGLPQEAFSGLSRMLGLPKDWLITDELIDSQYNIVFTHGTKLSKSTIAVAAMKRQYSHVCGHQHSICNISYITEKLFTSFVGCGIDFSSSAFDYAKGGANNPILSCLVIVDGVPVLETMRVVE